MLIFIGPELGEDHAAFGVYGVDQLSKPSICSSCYFARRRSAALAAQFDLRALSSQMCLASSVAKRKKRAWPSSAA
jgi:hypothetical protein